MAAYIPMYDCLIGLNRKATKACVESDAIERDDGSPETYDCDTDLGVFIVHSYSVKKLKEVQQQALPPPRTAEL